MPVGLVACSETWSWMSTLSPGSAWYERTVVLASALPRVPLVAHRFRAFGGDVDGEGRGVVVEAADPATVCTTPWHPGRGHEDPEGSSVVVVVLVVPVVPMDMLVVFELPPPAGWRLAAVAPVS
jgi:hypothetical protein